MDPSGLLAIGSKLMSDDDDIVDELQERQRGLETLLGSADEMHLHGVVPFAFGLECGGTPDVLTFSQYTDQGKLYVTCELAGTDDQPPNEVGQYELAVCQKEPDTWALNLILQLSFYTLETPLNHGETMDIGSIVPPGSVIDAFLFKSLGTYEVFGRPASVICCIGITKSELDFRMEHGSSLLFDKLPSDYMLTETVRDAFI